MEDTGLYVFITDRDGIYIFCKLSTVDFSLVCGVKIIHLFLTICGSIFFFFLNSQSTSFLEEIVKLT